MLAALPLAGFAAACNPAGPPAVDRPPPRLPVVMVDDRELGDNPAQPDGLLGRPGTVRTDATGNVYVADRAAMTIRIYDAVGSLVRTVGRRGRAAGELLDITCFELDENGEIVVADGLNQRISRFSPEGQVIESRPMAPETLLWPRRIFRLGADRYLLLYKLPSTAPLLHVWSAGFTAEQTAFAPLADVAPADDPISDHFLRTFPGSLWLEPDGSVLLAPSLYRGEIHRYQLTGSDWKRTEVLAGYVQERKPYIAADPSRRAGGDLGFRISVPGHTYGGYLRNESRGLFRLNDGRLIHFTLIAEDGRRVFGVEVFDPQGKLAGYAPLREIEAPEGRAVTIPIHVEWKDAEDRFYLRQQQEEKGRLRIVHLTGLDATPAASRSAGDSAS